MLARIKQQKNLLLFLGSNYLIKGVGYLVQLLAIYYLFIEEVGYIRFAFNYLEFFGVVSVFGMTTLLLKVNSNSNITLFKRNENFTNAFIFVLSFSFLASLLLAFISTEGVLSSNDQINHLVLFFSLFNLVNALNSILTAELQSSGEFLFISKVQTYTKAVGLLVFYLLIKIYGLTGFVIGNYIVSGSCLIWYLIFFIKNNKFVKTSLSSTVSFYILNFKLTIYAFLSNSLGTFNKFLGVFILGRFHFDEVEFGALSVVLTLIIALEIITSTLQQFFLPKLSFKSSSSEGWRKYFKKIESKFIWISFLIFIIVNLFAYSSFIIIDFDYNDFLFNFLLLSFSWFVGSFYMLKGPAFISIGKVKWNFYISLLLTPINFIVTYFLISEYLVAGVVFSRLLQAFYTACIFNFFFRYEYKK